jgi:hypothetical protein
MRLGLLVSILGGVGGVAERQGILWRWLQPNSNFITSAFPQWVLWSSISCLRRFTYTVPEKFFVGLALENSRNRRDEMTRNRIEVDSLSSLALFFSPKNCNNERL